MAQGEERRMLFDIRGRRKNVIRVIYAILALLMGASLFLVVGPFNLAEVVGGGGSGDAAEIYQERAERIEGRLAKDPKDEALLLSLTRTRIAAGTAQAEQDPTTGRQTLTPEAKAELEAALDAWSRYLAVAGSEPNPSAAQLVANSSVQLAETGDTVREIEENFAIAVEAQRIAAEARPSVGSLTTLAIFQYYNGEFAAGDQTAKRAQAEAAAKSERNQIEKQMAQYRKRGEAWRKQAEKFAKLERKQGKEQLENPLGGLSGGSGLSP
jgi:hypothetical protein